MEETEFALTERFFLSYKRLYVKRVIPLLLILLLAALFVPEAGMSLDPFMTVVMVCVLGGAFAYGGWQGYKRQVEGFRGYRIGLSESSIRRSQPGLPDIVIPREGVTRIVRAPGKGVTVTGRERQEVIGIPETLEGFAVVENTLESWRPFEARKSTLAPWMTLLGLVGMLAAFITLYRSTDKIVVTACGGALIALMAYSAIATGSSPHLDERTKRTFRWMSPFIILVIAVQIWVAWTR